LVLKSFGKFFGLAGVRLGFAVGHAEITAKLGAMLGPWAVPGAGLHVGAKAMSDITWINRTRDTARKEAGELRALLSEHGFGDVGHTDLFVTVSHSDTRAVAQGLARHKILVRTFDYAKTWMRFGLPGDEAAFTRLRTALPSIER
ncbi:MAG: aminotransferase class I/II-fold pyridoxal phosphate-dependent enzyme, partial [Pseudomonadota bacterium]